jgi:prefoldin subunit 5
MDTTAQSQRALVASEALFTTMGEVGPAQMRGALTAASDLAVFFGGDLAQATETIIKATEGSTRGLKALGIELDTTRIQGEGLPYVLGEIEKHVGGQAQAQLDTYAGKMEHLRSEWEKLQESFGKIIATADKQTGFLSGWSTVLSGVSASIDKFGLLATAVQLSQGKLLEVVDAGTLVEKQANKAADALDTMATEPVDKLAEFEAHLASLSQSTSDLSPKLQDLIERGHELGVSVKDIAAGIGMSTEAVTAFLAKHQEMTESLRRGQEVADTYLKFWTKIREESVLFVPQLGAGIRQGADPARELDCEDDGRNPQHADRAAPRDGPVGRGPRRS